MCYRFKSPALAGLFYGQRERWLLEDIVNRGYMAWIGSLMG